jgi:hypothetical protein
MAKNTQTAPAVVSASASAKAAKAIGAAYGTHDGKAKALAATLLGSVIAAFAKLPNMTDALWSASTLGEELRKELTDRNLSDVPGRLSKLKVVALVVSNRPAGIAAGQWEGDAGPGETFAEYVDRVRELRDNLRTPQGVWVMKRNASGGKATVAGKARGTTAANKGTGKAAIAAKNSAPAVTGPSAKDVAEARTNAFLVVMGTPKNADALKRIVDDKAMKAKLLAAMASIIAEADTAKNVFASVDAGKAKANGAALN